MMNCCNIIDGSIELTNRNIKALYDSSLSSVNIQKRLGWGYYFEQSFYQMDFSVLDLCLDLT